MNSNFDFKEFTLLGDKVKSGKATTQERDEFMRQLYQNGNLTKQQYNDYLKNKENEDIIGFAVALGAIVLLGYLISDLFNRK